MKIRLAVFAVLFWLPALSCNLEKTPAVIDNSAVLSVTDEAEQESEKEIMYVSSPDGLRVRKDPSFDSEKVYLLSHLQPVSVLEKDETVHTIDYITGNWYLIESDDATGWVFSGYLRKTIEAAKRIETIAGKYRYSSIDIQREENSNPKAYIREHEKTYFTLTLENSDTSSYIFATNYADNSTFWETRSVTIYKDSSREFYIFYTELGGASGLCAFYYRNNAVVMHIEDEVNPVPWEVYHALGEGEEVDLTVYPLEKLFLEMTFTKE